MAAKDARQSQESAETKEKTTSIVDDSPAERLSDTERRQPRADGKIQLEETDCYDKLGFCWAPWRKWSILSVIFIVQLSMNFNASVYSNAVIPLSNEFGISENTAMYGQMIMLLFYAFGCELWAPWSEEFGRWPILQLSLLFVNIWQIPCALAPNFATMLAGRALLGLSSAGGSVTLGMVADMWEPDKQQYAVAFVVLSSVGGSVLGPIFGGIAETYLSWHWIFWLQLIFGVFVQVLHLFVPETRVSKLLTKEAERRRANDEGEFYSPDELKEHRFETKEVIKIWIRPFHMFICEPIVLWLSLLSGFSDALIFTFLSCYKPVFAQWGFTPLTTGLSFVTFAIAYVIAYFSFFPFFRRHNQIRAKDADALQPEARLYWLLWTAPCLFIGMFGFAWTSTGPPMPWIVPLIFAVFIGIANYNIYMATIDYMVASYGPYSASATGGNGFARDFLAGIAALYAGPLYENLGLRYASTLLACLAVVVTVPLYIFYRYGPQIRERSKFAQVLASDRRKKDEKLAKTAGQEALVPHDHA